MARHCLPAFQFRAPAWPGAERSACFMRTGSRDSALKPGIRWLNLSVELSVGTADPMWFEGAPTAALRAPPRIHTPAAGHPPRFPQLDPPGRPVCGGQLEHFAGSARPSPAAQESETSHWSGSSTAEAAGPPTEITRPMPPVGFDRPSGRSSAGFCH